MKKWITPVPILLLLLAVSCKDPYYPSVRSSDQSALVVEGVLNVAGSTNIRLSRSSNVGYNRVPVPELNAYLEVTGENNTQAVLNDTGNGNYYSADLQLEPGKKYQLYIRTSSGKEYQSTAVVAKMTPPIDSLAWIRNSNGVDITFDTQDPTNNTRYYKWDFEETWEINSARYSTAIFQAPDTVRTRIFPDEEIFTCYKSHKSATINLGNTTRLASDLMKNEELLTIPNNDEKLAVRYSILLRLHALDKESYAFYELLRKNSESIGTIFDALPTELQSNIKCLTDPSELVLGYINAASIIEKRIFILKSQVQGWFYIQNCVDRLVPPDSIVYYFAGGSQVPYEIVFGIGGSIRGYNASLPGCVDCRQRGGTKLKPSFW